MACASSSLLLAVSRFRAYASRLQYTVRLEVARAIANALDLDYQCSQIVWIVSDDVMSLLREFAKTPGVTVPSHGNHASCLRGIEDVESACRSARALGNECLFGRVHVPSGNWSRWVFLSETGFVKACDYSGPTRGGKTVMWVPATSGPRNRIQGCQSEQNTRYGGGFKSGSRRRGSSQETRKSVASWRSHRIWLTHRSRYRRVPAVTLPEGPTVNVSVRFPSSGSGSGETASVAGTIDSTAGYMVRGHALWLFVFRWRFRVVARSRLTALFASGILSVPVACMCGKQPIADRLRHIRRSIRYAGPPPHIVAILKCGGPEK